jgi:hypothetical protein
MTTFQAYLKSRLEETAAVAPVGDPTTDPFAKENPQAHAEIDKLQADVSKLKVLFTNLTTGQDFSCGDNSPSRWAPDWLRVIEGMELSLTRLGYSVK